MRRDRRLAFTLALLTTGLTEIGLSAHRSDEYLQAARLAVEPRRAELYLDLTPGIEVAESVIREVDRDRDGRLSADERQAYVSKVQSALELGVDGRSLQVGPVTATFPDPDAFRDGTGTIRLQTTIRLPRLAVGDHELVFRNRYRPDVSVYLANALVPDGDRVAIIAQRRDAAQHELTIAYVVRSQERSSTPAWLAGILAGMLVVTLRGRW